MENNIQITDKEITMFEPLIFKIIKMKVLRFWGNKINSNNVMIGRMGMTVDDLMQIGRILVYNQIKWYKQHGDPSKSSLFTSIYNHLSNKFTSLSNKYICKKHGGPVVNVEETKKNVQTFVDTFNKKRHINTNKNKLTAFITCSDFLKDSVKTKKNNAQILQLAQQILNELPSNININFHDAENYIDLQPDWTPESILMVKEEINKRLREFRKSHAKSVKTVEDYISYKKRKRR
jgi:hypothetical protein